MTLTPEQFNKLATKDDFKELRSEMKNVKNEVKILINAMFELSQKLENLERISICV